MKETMQRILWIWYESDIVYKLVFSLLLAIGFIIAGKWNQRRNYCTVWSILILLCSGKLALIVYTVCRWCAKADLGTGLMALMYIFVGIGYLDLLIWILLETFKKREKI